MDFQFRPQSGVDRQARSGSAGFWVIFLGLGASANVNWALTRQQALKKAEIEFGNIRPLFLAAMLIGAQLANVYFHPELTTRGTLLQDCLVVTLGSVFRNEPIRSFLMVYFGKREQRPEREKER